MINDTMTEESFREDKQAVADLKDFLATDSGRKFAAALRGGHPLDILTTVEKKMPLTIRPAAIAESANPNMLLGMCEGYHLALKLIDGLCVGKVDEKKKQASTHLGRVTSALNQQAT